VGLRVKSCNRTFLAFGLSEDFSLIVSALLIQEDAFTQPRC